MLVKTYASAVYGIEALTITIEINAGGNVAGGSLGYFLVGLPDAAVKEGYQRIEAALKNQSYKMPRMKIVVNMAPADLKKEGTAYDLPIAIGILAATEQISTAQIEGYMVMGELSLDGSLRPVKGALPMAIEARKRKFKGLILPRENAEEAAIVNDLDVYGFETVSEVCDFLCNPKKFKPVEVDTRTVFSEQSKHFEVDFSDVQGQENIKRAFEIAAAGGHNAILIGPPGAGKTMLARRLPTILPELSLREALETTKIHSVAGLVSARGSLVSTRPFRSPHHTISDVALVGGGSNPAPGEISLAHNGVLFLDELPEFKRSVLEVLRQPLEERKVTISRARMTVDYPAGFMLVASMNPCPCGYYNHPEKDCSCSAGTIQRYLNKISGPLLDRIDLHVEVTPVSFRELAAVEKRPQRSSAEIREKVQKAKSIQEERFASFEGIYTNAQMPSPMVRKICAIDKAGVALLKTAMEKLKLSARAYDRILRVARTAADLDGEQDIQIGHLAEAIQYRSLDKEGWAT